MFNVKELEVLYVEHKLLIHVSLLYECGNASV